MSALERSRAYLDARVDRRATHKILHSFPSPYYWRRTRVPTGKLLDQHLPAEAAKAVNLYVGVPFCVKTKPGHCGFCLFPSEVYTKPAAVDEYLGYVRREAQLLRPHLEGRRISAIYFGGGTPNLLKAHQYSALADVVREAFGAMPQGIEITLEGLPALFNRAKLEAAKEVGVNRVSMGVQQLNEDLIKLSGRGQRSKKVFENLELWRELGLKSSIDLIYGWPKQTLELMLADLQQVIDHDVKHLTFYELNLGGPKSTTAFATTLKDQLPTVQQNLEMYRAATELLTANGYTRESYCDWKKVDPDDAHGYRFEQKLRDVYDVDGQDEVLGYDMVGIGFAGVTHLNGTPDSPGWCFMNEVELPRYYKELDEGRFPSMVGFKKTKTDNLIATVFQGIQNLRVDRRMFSRVFGVDIHATFEPHWAACAERGWAQIDDDAITITGDGAYYVPAIQSLLSAERKRELESVPRKVMALPWYWSMTGRMRAKAAREQAEATNLKG